MKSRYAIILMLCAMTLASVSVRAATPVTVREQGTTLILANDYLERTIEVVNGAVHTVRLVNKLSGRTHEVRATNSKSSSSMSASVTTSALKIPWC